MTLHELQDQLRLLGFYTGLVDGLFGKQTQDAVLKATSRVDESPLTSADYEDSAARLGIETAVIKAFATVESGGKSGFTGARPTVLYEPHIFSRLTSHVFDLKHQWISYPNWKDRPYPATQDERWLQIAAAVGLNPDAGFSSASYGAYQIMGMNHRMCGFDSPFEFALAMAHGEASQLLAFEAFCKARGGLVWALKRKDWREAARLFNGAGQVDLYSGKLAAAYRAAGGR